MIVKPEKYIHLEDLERTALAFQQYLVFLFIETL